MRVCVITCVLFFQSSMFYMLLTTYNFGISSAVASTLVLYTICPWKKIKDKSSSKQKLYFLSSDYMLQMNRSMIGHLQDQKLGIM